MFSNESRYKRSENNVLLSNLMRCLIAYLPQDEDDDKKDENAHKNGEEDDPPGYGWWSVQRHCRGNGGAHLKGADLE